MTSGKNKLIALFAVAIVVIAGVVIFTADNSKDDGDFTVTDMRGRIVSIPSNVDKIVCLSAGSLRLVVYLGAADMVVGIDKEDSNVSKPTYYKGTYHIAFDVKGIANVGNEENFKAIKDTGAQVIISSATDVSKLDDLQDKTGISVVGIDAGGNRGVASDELSKNLKLLGKVLDKSDRANQLTNYIKDTMKTMEDLSKKSTVIKDATELKVKESNRIDVIVENLSAMGCDITATEDGMIIKGGNTLHGAEIDSHLDHRIAMSFAIASLIADGVTRIKDASCVNISYPSFYQDLASLC